MLPTLYKKFLDKDEKLKERLRKGIPDNLRLKVWPIIADVDRLKNEIKKNYTYFLSRSKYPYINDILQDVTRTFPSHEFFKEYSGN